MKTKKVSILFLTGIFVVITLEVVISDAFGLSNGPNYWGMGYPGSIQSKDRYKHPELPSDYIFGAPSDNESKGYDGSHYGTHDWLADASLRSLIDASKNPLFYLDWRWLITPDIARNKWPAWKADYGGTSGKHEVVRSYISYLYATQMPDTKITPELHIPQEGVTIKDMDGYGKKWIGQKTKHIFQFEIIGNGVYEFCPVNTPNLNKIKLVSEEAIKCIGKTQKDEDNNIISSMQPEGAAIWLGAMTHYIADMVSPAHLLMESKFKHVYSSSYYHNWFENNLASVTKWDKAYKARGGPEQGNFSYDYKKVTLAPIIPIKPDIATTLMAITTIKTAYRTDGRHQHIPLSNNNNLEAENSGLFINETELNPNIYWDWKIDLGNIGRSNSIHRYFYDKVEHLLCWATYYTACAMQYCYNEGKEKNNNDVLNTDYFVRNPVLPGPISVRPEPDSDTIINKLLNIVPLEVRESVSRNLKNIGGLIWSIALAGISNALKTLFDTTR
jgi:hypothetical protein